MDFSWTAEQLARRLEVIEFAEANLNDGLEERDRDLVFPQEAWQRCAEFGILGCNVPGEHGGNGRDVLNAVCLLEALGQGCRDNGLLLALNAQIWTIHEPLLAFGSEEQKQKYLPALCSGQIIAADAITEEDAGSDAMGMETTARRSGDGYVLNGRKMFIGMAPRADLAIVFAKTDPEAGQWGISAFLVERGTPGFSCSENRAKMGLRTMPMGEFTFEDCVVPESCRLGGEGAGMSLFNHTMEWERCLILSSHVGAMARQLDECVAFAKKRTQFGQTLGGFQSVTNRIAEMALRVETCRTLLYKVAWLKHHGKPAALEAAMAKLHFSECFTASSLDAIRTHGARGYLTDFGIERDLRDAVGGVIYAGTSDIQRNLIARLLGL
jgi:alkylation response protein AidB-like acyl-CoA dehydrogenase